MDMLQTDKETKVGGKIDVLIFLSVSMCSCLMFVCLFFGQAGK